MSPPAAPSPLEAPPPGPASAPRTQRTAPALRAPRLSRYLDLRDGPALEPLRDRRVRHRRAADGPARLRGPDREPRARPGPGRRDRAAPARCRPSPGRCPSPSSSVPSSGSGRLSADRELLALETSAASRRDSSPAPACSSPSSPCVVSLGLLSVFASPASQREPSATGWCRARRGEARHRAPRGPRHEPRRLAHRSAGGRRRRRAPRGHPALHAEPGRDALLPARRRAHGRRWHQAPRSSRMGSCSRTGSERASLLRFEQMETRAALDRGRAGRYRSIRSTTLPLRRADDEGRGSGDRPRRRALARDRRSCIGASPSAPPRSPSVCSPWASRWAAATSPDRAARSWASSARSPTTRSSSSPKGLLRDPRTRRSLLVTSGSRTLVLILVVATVLIFRAGSARLGVRPELRQGRRRACSPGPGLVTEFAHAHEALRPAPLREQSSSCAWSPSCDRRPSSSRTW